MAGLPHPLEMCHMKFPCRKCDAVLKSAQGRSIHERHCDGLVGQKLCKSCERVFPLSAFTRHKSTSDGLHTHCRECKNAKINEWRSQNADRMREYARRRYLAETPEQREVRYEQRRQAYAADRRRFRDEALKRKFGISLADYEAMLVAQGGRCAICGAPPSEGRALAVDHCHATGKVRELLCINCNNGLGRFRDDPDLFRRAIEYLCKHARSPTS